MASNVKYLDPKADLTFKKIFGKSAEDFKIYACSDEELRAFDKFWDRVSSEKTLMEGRYDEGVKDGIEKGVLEGETNKALEIARKMTAAGMDAKTICEMTGVSKEEMETL